MPEAVVRHQYRLYREEDVQQLPGKYPIHPAGVAIFWYNADENDADVQASESSDGTTWTPIVASVRTVVARGWAYCYFRSLSRYVRLELDQEQAAEGVTATLTMPYRPTIYTDVDLI